MTQSLADFAKSFTEPKSLCKCGHDGDGSVSDHKDAALGLAKGHGACKVADCPCKRFTWVSYSPSFKLALEARK